MVCVFHVLQYEAERFRSLVAQYTYGFRSRPSSGMPYGGITRDTSLREPTIKLPCSGRRNRLMGQFGIRRCSLELLQILHGLVALGTKHMLCCCSIWIIAYPSAPCHEDMRYSGVAGGHVTCPACYLPVMSMQELIREPVPSKRVPPSIRKLSTVVLVRCGECCGREATSIHLDEYIPRL